MHRILVIVTLAAIALSACTWVKPTDGGARVVVAEPFNVRDCERVSTITTSVKHTVGNMQRKAEKVEQELTTLARNEAAIRGGDTVVPRGEVKDGARTFEVYRCGG